MIAVSTDNKGSSSCEAHGPSKISPTEVTCVQPRSPHENLAPKCEVKENSRKIFLDMSGIRAAIDDAASTTHISDEYDEDDEIEDDDDDDGDISIGTYTICEDVNDVKDNINTTNPRGGHTLGAQSGPFHHPNGFEDSDDCSLSSLDVSLPDDSETFRHGRRNYASDSALLAMPFTVDNYNSRRLSNRSLSNDSMPSLASFGPTSSSLSGCSSSLMVDSTHSEHLEALPEAYNDRWSSSSSNIADGLPRSPGPCVRKRPISRSPSAASTASSSNSSLDELIPPTMPLRARSRHGQGRMRRPKGRAIPREEECEEDEDAASLYG